MAHPALLIDPCFLLLVRHLRLPLPHVLGHWELIEQNAHARADGTFNTGPQFEAAAHWHGKPGAFTKAALAAGLVLYTPRKQLTIRGYLDRAPDYVKKRIARAAAGTPATTAPAVDTGGQRPPLSAYDPIRSRDRSTTPIPRASEEAGSGSTEHTHHTPGGSPLEPPQRGPESLQGDLNALMTTLAHGKKPHRAPWAKFDWGAAGPEDLTDFASSLDTKHDATRARSLWRARHIEIWSIDGGPEFLRKLYKCVWSTLYGPRRRTAPPIHNPARYLNSETGRWLKANRGRKAS